MKEQEPRDILQLSLAWIRRREIFTRILGILSTHLLVFLSLFTGYFLAQRLFSFPDHTLAVLIAALSLAVLSTLLRVIWLLRFSLFDAAVLADDRLRLKERASSAFYLRQQPDPLRDPAWSELIQRDGERSLAGGDLKKHFPIRIPWSARWILAPVALTLLFTLIPPIDLLGLRENRLIDAALRKEVERKRDELAEKLEELRKEAKKSDPEVEKALEAFKKSDLEKKKGELPPKGEDVKREAMVKFTRLEEAVKKSLSRERFDRLKQFLDRFPPGSMSRSPLTGKIREALKEGDFAKAQSELGKLSEDLRALLKKKESGELSKEDEEKLKNLSEELQRLSRDAKLLSNLAGALQGASMSMSAGDLSKALENLQGLDGELLRLDRLAEEMKFLEDALELAQLSLDDLGKLHKCPNCGKLSYNPGGT